MPDNEPLTSGDVPGNVPTPETPPDSEQSGKQGTGTSTPDDTDESKKLPNPDQ